MKKLLALALTFVAFSAIASEYNTNRNLDAAKDNTRAAGQNLKEAGKDAYYNTKANASNAAESTKEATSNGLEKAKDMGYSAWETVSGAVANMWHKLTGAGYSTGYATSRNTSYMGSDRLDADRAEARA